MMNSIIDTMEIKIELGNLKEFNKVKFEEYGFVKSVKMDITNDKCYVIIALSLNRVLGHYARIEGLKGYKKTFKEVMELFGVVIADDVNLNRIDIAIDTELKFHDNFKYFLYIFELITYSDKKSDKWYTVNLETLRQNTIKQLGRGLEVVFYDKECESQGRHLYKTRMEFRYKRLSALEFEANMVKLIELINTIDINIELLDKNMIDRLCRIYDNEIKLNKVKNLSEFVRKFSDYIYTTEVMQGLYNHSELKGKYQNWLREYRKTNQLELFTKKTVIEYQADCIRSLKNYKKN